MKKIIIRDIVIVIIFLAGVILLSNKINKTPERKTFEEVLLNDSIQALIERGIPEEVIRSYKKSRNFRDSAAGIFPFEHEIVPLSHELEWKIYFKKENTVNGNWRGKFPKLEIIGPETVRDCFTKSEFKATTREVDWKKKIKIESHPGQSGGGISPYLNVYIPTPSPECLHRTILARASMEFIYPAPYGLKSYTNENKNLTRELKFFIISEEELSVLQKLIPLRKLDWRVLRTLFFVISGIVFFILAIELKNEIWGVW